MTAPERTSARPIERPADAGFSLIELVLAMFLLAIIALAVAPLIMSATRASTVNRSLVVATAFANAQLAQIRDAYPDASLTTSCAALRSSQIRTGITGAADPLLRGDVAVGACPATFPAAVPVTVSVYSASTPGSVLVSLPSSVLVAAP